jgi:hypothetical protein
MIRNLKPHRVVSVRDWQWLACLAILLCADPSYAQSQVVMVEEHWELKIAEPDSASSSPQTSMVMSPTGDADEQYFVFTLNHHNSSGFQAGGLQVQEWDGDDLVDDRSAHEDGTLSHSGETITWVQRLELTNGLLKFGVYNGTSETWGTFGGSDMTLSAQSSLGQLNGYRPAVSLTESQVGFAENRVDSLVLKKLVWKTSDGQVYEQNAPIPIDTTLE